MRTYRAIAGDLADLSDGGVAVVGDDPRLLGDTVAIEFERSTLEAPIVAVVARSTGGFEAPLYFVDRATLDALVGRLLDALLFGTANARSCAWTGQPTNGPGAGTLRVPMSHPRWSGR